MKKIIILFALLASLSSAAFAQQKDSETPVKSLYSYELDNGLKLFVVENHSVPLTYIEIAVRCGAYTQSPDNAGLFHLYEHMMFEGNSLYKDAAAVTRAMSDMGVPERNGSTQLECVNYYFTVPSDMTEKGLEFWNVAIRAPLLDKKELEAQKKVVISEINGMASNPSKILLNEKNLLMFGDSPYSVDVSGDEDSINKATIKQLKDIQKKYYVPNNTAIFVGGDVNPDEVYSMVKSIYGSWKKGKDPFASGMVRHEKAPFTNPELRVMPFDRLSDQLGQILVEFRGPDGAYDLEDTYSMDVLSFLMEDPQGEFKKAVVEDTMIGVPDSSYTGGGYATKKTCGIISFYGVVCQPELDMPERAVYFAENISSMVQKVSEKVTEKQLKTVETRLEDQNIISGQTASGLLSSLRFWWCCTDENYYYTYNQKIAEITGKDLEALNEKYIRGKNPLITVLVSPAVYESTKESFEKAGFKEIKR